VELAKRFKFAVIQTSRMEKPSLMAIKAPSFLSTKVQKDVGVEFTTLSKTYSMADSGWFCRWN
jgi:aspartate/methionine/tyrosine aminotransferase